MRGWLTAPRAPAIVRQVCGVGFERPNWRAGLVANGKTGDLFFRKRKILGKYT